MEVWRVFLTGDGNTDDLRGIGDVSFIGIWVGFVVFVGDRESVSGSDFFDAVPPLRLTCAIKHLIGDYLGVPVIAEGVETEEQLRALRIMGCDLVQGYYFSKPVPSAEYDHFVQEKKEHLEARGENGEEEGPADMLQADPVSYVNIAHALSSGFDSIYYVDVNNGHYVEFSSRGEYRDLQIDRSGEDFFGDTQRNLPNVIHEEDRARVSANLEKEALLAQLSSDDHFSMTYRMIVNGRPIYYNLKVVRAQGRDDHHIVIGISNVDQQMRQTLGYEEAKAKSIEFYNIAQALSSDFESIFYVDTDTCEYTEFVSQGSYESLKVRTNGKDFFADCQADLPSVIYSEDQEKMAAAMQRDALLFALEYDSVFTLDYRLMIDGEPVYYRLKAVPAESGDDHHIVVGVSNIASQVANSRELEKASRASLTYSRIAQALSQDYFTIFYVNTETDRFMEYNTLGPNHSLNLERTGEAFFEDCKQTIPLYVPAEDRERALDAFNKENLLKELENGRTFSLSFRLLIDGEPVHANVKAIRPTDDDTHIVIGISNIDAQIKREEEYQAAMAQSLTYSRIAQALARDYFSIFYVDIDSNEFTEYSSNGPKHELMVEQTGADFFETTKQSIDQVVYDPDREKATHVWDKANIMRELQKSPTFSTSYRILIDDYPVYINCKIMRMTDLDDHHIVVGISNIDAQMKREKEFAEAQEMAMKDALTGIRNKRAYNLLERELNRDIGLARTGPFAVVVCDLNGLKEVNDTQGHEAGDQYIKDACMTICHTFQHSPVFRIGGDEFTAILRGEDFENRFRLMEQIQTINEENRSTGKAILACGMSEFQLQADINVGEVFQRADDAMYENKMALKGAR